MSEIAGVQWGEGLVVAAFRSEGGIKSAVDRIQRTLGPTVGNRNTFAKLLRVDDQSVLNDRDRWRAWLLITALGEHPDEWGIRDNVVPPLLDATGLKVALQPKVGPEGLEPSTRGLQGRRFGRQPHHIRTVSAAA